MSDMEELTVNRRGTTFSSDSEDDPAPQPASFWSSDEDDAGEAASDREDLRKKAQQSLLTGVTTGLLELLLGKAQRHQIRPSGSHSTPEFTRQSDILHAELAEMRSSNRRLQHEVESSQAKCVIMSNDLEDLAKDNARLKDALQASQLQVQQLTSEIKHFRSGPIFLECRTSHSVGASEQLVRFSGKDTGVKKGSDSDSEEHEGHKRCSGNSDTLVADFRSKLQEMEGIVEHLCKDKQIAQEELEHLRKEKQSAHEELSQVGLKVESRFDSFVAQVKSEAEELKESRDEAVLKREEQELRMSYFEDNCCRLNKEVRTFQTEQMVAEDEWGGRHRQQEEAFQERHRESGLLNTRLESHCDQLRAELAEQLSIHEGEFEECRKSEKSLENRLHVVRTETESLQENALDKAGLEIENKELQDLIAHQKSEAFLREEEYKEHEQRYKQDIELLSSERNRFEAAQEEYNNVYGEERSGTSEIQNLAQEGVFEDIQDQSITRQHGHRSLRGSLESSMVFLEGEHEAELSKKAELEIAELLKQRQLLEEQVEAYRRTEAAVAEEVQQPWKQLLNGRGALQSNSPRERKRLAGLAQSNAAAVATLLRQVRSLHDTEADGGLEDGVYMGGSQLRAVHALEQQTNQLGHTNHQWASYLAGRSNFSLPGGSGWTRGLANDDMSRISFEHWLSDSAAHWGNTVTDFPSPLASPGPVINSALEQTVSRLESLHGQLSDPFLVEHATDKSE